MSESYGESSSTGCSSVIEYSIRVPKNEKAKFNVMRFNNALDVDFTNWTHVKMERENNKAEKSPTEEIPKFGAGSEYRRDEKEEARRKRLGFMPKRYNSAAQPYSLKVGGKNGKKFRGTREGGVTDNSSYYVFMHGNDNIIEAYPIAEWYNFVATNRFKALSAEEAEQEFGKRNKSIAYFSNMMRKRIRKDEDEELEDEGKRKGKKRKDFKISDMDDDCFDSDDDNSDDKQELDDSDDEKNKKGKKKVAPKKRKVVNDDESAVEESDDGDEEGRELDYISDSSESVSDDEAKVDKEMKGVAEEGALRKLLTSDEEDDDEEKLVDESNKTDAAEEKHNEDESAQQILQKKNKRSKSFPGPSSSKINEIGDSSSDVSADTTDSETEKHQAIIGSDSQVNYKIPLKKQLLDPSSDIGISEEAVRRYLARKPMTTTELLQKFKKPKTNLSSDQLVNTMTQILKKINPIKQTIKDKMYLSVKLDSSSSH